MDADAQIFVDSSADRGRSPEGSESREGGVGSSRRTDGDKAPIKVSCLSCRTAKCRCAGNGRDPCSRCLRGHLECIYVKHQRGRKFGTRPSKRLYAGSTTELSARPSGTMASETPTAPPPPPPLHTLVSLSQSPASPVAAGVSPASQASATSRRSEPISAPSLIPREDLGGHSLGSLLNPYQEGFNPDTDGGVADGSSPAHPSFGNYLGSYTDMGGLGDQFGLVDGLKRNDDWEDPVSAGIMTLVVAREMCAFFFTRLNVLSNLLDPILNDVPALRSRSAFLFTSVITSATRLYRTELGEACRKLLRQQALRIFDKNYRSLEIVQGFILAANWKELKDNTQTMYLGFALRMASELGLDSLRMPVMFGDEEKVERQKRARVRTWLIYATDQSYYCLIGKSPMCSGKDSVIEGSRDWHKSRYATLGDALLVGWVQARRVAARTVELFRTMDTNNPVDHSAILAHVNWELTQLQTYWLEQLDAPTQSMYHPLARFYTSHIRLFLNTFGIRDADNLVASSTCLSSASESLRAVLEMERHPGLIRYIQDNATLMSSYAAIWLVNLIQSAPLKESEIGVRSEALLYDASETFMRASENPLDTCILQANFLKSLLARHRSAVFTKLDHAEGSSPQTPLVQASADERSPYLGSLHSDEWSNIFGVLSRTPLPHQEVPSGTADWMGGEETWGLDDTPTEEERATAEYFADIFAGLGSSILDFRSES